MKLKIGRHTYEITNEDIFSDNGITIQLVTQSKENKITRWDAYPPNPVLSYLNIKEINKFEKLIIKENGHVKYFKLAI